SVLLRVTPLSRCRRFARRWRALLRARTAVAPFSGARGFFRLDARNAQLAVTGATRPHEARDWVGEAIARAGGGTPANEHALFLAPATGGRVVGAVVRRAPERQGRVREVVGFEADAASLSSIFNRILEREPLLPPSLTGGVVDNSMIAVQVTAASGKELYRSAENRTSNLAATGSLGDHLGNLRYRLSLRPDAASRLLIGGLPASRLPLLGGLLLLAAGLVVAAGFQLRREFELARLRSEFVSNVSHELRTPLAQIRMFTETLLLGRVRSDAERVRSLEVIAREARRLGQLVENVLRFSRTAPAGRATRKTTSVVLLAAEVIEDFAPLAEPRRTRFEARLDHALVASIDPGMFRQMLLNLLDNAVKYGPLGQTVLVTVEAKNDHVSLVVEDQGPGVPQEDRARIWEPFRRARSAEAEAVPGTGIGLAVVREIAELHGGRAWVEGSPAGGARFGVELPGAQRTATADLPEASDVRDESLRWGPRRRASAWRRSS
ncbi:MAG: sensor histidine kinase, partial [Vicinamibacteraceae bacterium]